MILNEPDTRSNEIIESRCCYIFPWESKESWWSQPNHGLPRAFRVEVQDIKEIKISMQLTPKRQLEGFCHFVNPPKFFFCDRNLFKLLLDSCG